MKARTQFYDCQVYGDSKFDGNACWLDQGEKSPERRTDVVLQNGNDGNREGSYEPNKKGGRPHWPNRETSCGKFNIDPSGTCDIATCNCFV